MSGLKNLKLFSPTDYRYSVQDLEPYLSEEALISYMARIEGALAKILDKRGICSKKIAEEILQAAHQVTAREVYEEFVRLEAKYSAPEYKPTM